jgi:hypothetical protein
MHSITNDIFFKELVIKKLGFFPMNLNTVEDQTLINFKNFLSVYFENNIIHAFNNTDEAIHFNLVKHNENSVLTIYLTEFRHLSSLTTLMNNFKNLFNEFYLDKCVINHSPDLIIRLKINNQIIELPPYINCTIIKSKKLFNINF